MAAFDGRSISPLSAPRATLYDKLNSRWHKRALQLFLVIVLAHWAEHLLQAWQIFYLGWPRPKAGGILGLLFPWLISSEVLHYGYALIMLIGIWVLRNGFSGLSRTWWTAALILQFWHHLEHVFLIGQVIAGHYLFHSPVPISVLQLLVPRVELHLFYNSVVFIPMVVAFYFHALPPRGAQYAARCTCSAREGSAKLIAA